MRPHTDQGPVPRATARYPKPEPVKARIFLKAVNPSIVWVRAKLALAPFCDFRPKMARVKTRRKSRPSPDRDPAADGAVEHVGRLLDAIRRRVQRAGYRVLRLPCAIDGGGAHVAGGLQLLLHRAQARIGVEQ